MASNKIKFKMSIEKIEFEFEGDYEQGKAIQQGISSTLGGLSNIQNRVMGAPDVTVPKMIEGKAVESTNPLPRGRKRRRKSMTASTDGESGAEAVEGVDGNAEGESTRRVSSGPSPRSLIIELRKEGYFDTKRTLGDVKTELNRKGYGRIKSSDISSPMANLTQKTVLRRDKDEGLKQYVYTNGAKSDPE